MFENFTGFLEGLFIFIIFLCPLVFFHELGHFIFARLFGVRVEVFSLGFGPKLFKFRKGDTEYAFSLIPLGGYVKMFGDDPTQKDQIQENDRKFSFTYKSKWARFWIVFGGPMANFILAFFIFWSLIFVGENLPEIKFGFITKNTQFYEKGVRSGDILSKVNDVVISSPTDIMSAGDMVNSITIKRGTNDVRIPLGIDSNSFFEMFSKVSPLLRLPLVVNKSGEFYKVSLSKTFNEGEKLSLEEIIELAPANTVYLYKIGKDKNVDLGKNLNPELEIVQATMKTASLSETLREMGFYAHDQVVKSVNMDSPADKAGIKGGDILLSVNGDSVGSFEEVRQFVQKLDSEKKVFISVLSNQKESIIEIKPEVIKQDGKGVRIIGVYSGAEFLPLNFVKSDGKGFFQSIPIAFMRTLDASFKIFDGFKKLITKEVSLKNIGGPIAIGKVATDSFKTSLSYFFQIMAFISINLGVINLLPVPVLDGGHIMFIFLEILNRGPLSRRKMEIAQQFGLSILLILTFAAIFNDFSKLF